MAHLLLRWFFEKPEKEGLLWLDRKPEELLMGLQTPQMLNYKVFFVEILTVQQKAGDTATQVKDIKHLLPTWVVQQRAATWLPCAGEKAGPNVGSSFKTIIRYKHQGQ